MRPLAAAIGRLEIDTKSQAVDTTVLHRLLEAFDQNGACRQHDALGCDVVRIHSHFNVCQAESLCVRKACLQRLLGVAAAAVLSWGSWESPQLLTQGLTMKGPALLLALSAITLVGAIAIAQTQPRTQPST